MKIQELIGKKVEDIKMEVKDFDYSGSIPLEESNSCVILNTGEIFKIPFRGADTLDFEPHVSESQKSIFTNKTSKLRSFFSVNNAVLSRNTRNIKGKVITAIYQYSESGDAEMTWDKCLIEVESGFLISELLMSPKGTGHTGIWIFTSKEDLVKKIGNGFKKFEKY